MKTPKYSNTDLVLHMSNWGKLKDFLERVRPDSRLLRRMYALELTRVPPRGQHLTKIMARMKKAVESEVKKGGAL